MDEQTSQRLGTVRLEPAGPVVAGSVGEWRLVYTVGSYGVDEGGTIKVAQRLASDWEVPQFKDPEAPAYTTVSTRGEAKLRLTYSPKGHVRPWKKCLIIDVYDGCLAPGDTVTIVLGDRSGGSPGIRAQTFQETAHEFRFLVDPTNACVVRRLPTSPRFQIVADETAELVCRVPSQAAVGRTVEVSVRAVDRWGNPATVPDGAKLVWHGTGGAQLVGTRVAFTTAGKGHVAVSAGGLQARSNPLVVDEGLPGLRRFWGDLHAQTEATVGTGTEDEYFSFARDQACLDFASHQANDFQVTDEFWLHLNRTIEMYHEDGRFVALPGYEWSGNTPAGGDRNVVYRREGFPILRSSHWQVPGTPEDELSPAHPADVLFERLREHVGAENALVAAHVGGRYADIGRYFDQDLCHLVEVVSNWGVFEWLLWDALEAGHIVGVTCNSDGHQGRPGAEKPGAAEFGVVNGLTCVLAPSLTRDAVFDALRARRCYGTTGPRVILGFEVDGKPMGSVLPWRPEARVRAGITGTAPIESLALYRGREVLHEVRPVAFENVTGSRRIRVRWGGARIRGRGRRAVWDGFVRLDGARLEKANTVGFDVPTHGITERWDGGVAFKSSTTGDSDGLDLWLDRSDVGQLSFESASGCCEVDLGMLGGGRSRQTFELGGLEMRVCVERYPEELVDEVLELDCQISPPEDGLTPYLVKAVQTDGHMAWASPVYVRRRER